MTDDLQPVFDALKGILKPLGKGMTVVHDEDAHYYLDTCKPGPNGKPMFFGAVRVMKGWVSFHLMPVYTAPELLDGVSPELRKRMQGKSCFNFKSVDKPLMKELGQLAKDGLARFKKDGLA